MLIETIGSAAMPISLKANMAKAEKAKASKDTASKDKASKDKVKTAKAKTIRPPATFAKRTQIVQRLWNAAESQVCDIEQRLQAIDPTKLQVEHNARALGLLAKVLKELVSIERIMDAPKNTKSEIEGRDAPPRNLEQFRFELEKRLNAMHKGRQPETADERDRPALVGGAAG